MSHRERVMIFDTTLRDGEQSPGCSMALPEHMAIIEALEARDTELAEKRARDHTLGLAAYVEAHGQELFT